MPPVHETGMSSVSPMVDVTLRLSGNVTGMSTTLPPASRATRCRPSKSQTAKAASSRGSQLGADGSNKDDDAEAFQVRRAFIVVEPKCAARGKADLFNRLHDFSEIEDHRTVPARIMRTILRGRSSRRRFRYVAGG